MIKLFETTETFHIMDFQGRELMLHDLALIGDALEKHSTVIVRNASPAGKDWVDTIESLT